MRCSHMSLDQSSSSNKDGNGLRNSENQSFSTKRKAATSDVPNYFAQGSCSLQTSTSFLPLTNHLASFSNTLSAATMDEISQEDELIAQFAGVASVPASEVTLLAPQTLCMLCVCGAL